jgi:hypothetical protein
MPNDPLVGLEAVIKKAAQARDELRQRLQDDHDAKEQYKHLIKAQWAEHKKALAATVSAIDRLLKEHGYGGLAIVDDEMRHSEIDRMVLEFEHGIRDHSKILLCVTPSGEFTCAVGVVTDESQKTRLPIEGLGAHELKAILAQAVEQCLSRKKS